TCCTSRCRRRAGRTRRNSVSGAALCVRGSACLILRDAEELKPNRCPDDGQAGPMVAIENAKIRTRRHAHLRRYDPTYRQLKQAQLASQKQSQPANLPLDELWEHQARLDKLSYAPEALRQIEHHSTQRRVTGKKLSVM